MKVALTTFVFCVAALLALGMVMLYSSSMAQVGTAYLVKQLVAGGLGLGLCILSAVLDYRGLKKFIAPLFVLAVLLLGLVFVPHLSGFLPCGIRNNGAARWIQFGNYSALRFQPSEFAKLVLLILLAWYCERFQRQMGTLRRGLLLPAIPVAVVLALMLKEPDVGNSLLLATVSGIVLVLGGLKLRYVVPPALIGIAAAGLFIYRANNAAPGSHLSMRSARVYSWLHLEETKQDKGLQAYQAMVALGSGGLLGKGLGDGRQKLGWIPEHHTDFIFSIIGEELGLVATLLVLATFICLVISGIYISYHASDTFGFLLGCGITFLIGLQAFINIGVVTSALPNKGLPLPFISYGPSNLVVMLLSVGLVLGIARQGRPSEVAASDPLTRSDDGEPNPFKRRAPKASGRGLKPRAA